MSAQRGRGFCDVKFLFLATNLAQWIYKRLLDKMSKNESVLNLGVLVYGLDGKGELRLVTVGYAALYFFCFPIVVLRMMNAVHIELSEIVTFRG